MKKAPQHKRILHRGRKIIGCLSYPWAKETCFVEYKEYNIALVIADISFIGWNLDVPQAVFCKSKWIASLESVYGIIFSAIKSCSCFICIG
uniref:Uncharacterized protein n=1 Tax=Rhipicephalus zambeziensis TaxID=60191 RepID=A0A224Y4Z3_9ACAR